MGRQYALTLSFAENESGGPISVKFQLEVEEWEVPPATQFIIVYAPNGGIGAVVTEYGWSNTSVLSGNPYATPSSEYSFMDWITHADANVVDGEHYVPGETIADISTDMTLYAQWGGEPAEPVENTSQWTYSYSGAAETFLTPQDDLQIYQKVIIFVL
jgi:hypothetical protein